MKKNTINILAFLAIGFSIGGIYRATDLKIAQLDNYEAVITKNIISDTYKLKFITNSEEIIQPIEYKDVLTLVKIDREISENKLQQEKINLEEAKKELEEMKIWQKLSNNGIELTEEQMEEILPAAAKRIKELEEEEQEVENHEPLNKNKSRMI